MELPRMNKPRGFSDESDRGFAPRTLSQPAQEFYANPTPEQLEERRERAMRFRKRVINRSKG